MPNTAAYQLQLETLSPCCAKRLEGVINSLSFVQACTVASAKKTARIEIPASISASMMKSQVMLSLEKHGFTCTHITPLTNTNADEATPQKTKNTSTKNTSTKNTSTKNTSAKNTSAKNTSAKNTSAKNTSAKNTSAKNTSAKNTSAKNTSANKTSIDSAASKTYRNLMGRALLAIIPGLALLLLFFIAIPLPVTVLYLITALTLPLLLISGWPVYTRAFKDIKRRHLSMDVLFTISTLTAWTASLLSVVAPTLMLMPMFEAALLIIGFRNLGLAIESKLKARILKDTRFSDRLAKHATVRINNKDIKRELNTLKVGDEVIVRSGEWIPVDGTIIKGKAKLHDSIMTGDITKKSRQSGKVYNGMKVTEGEITVKVSQTLENSLLARLDRALNNESTPSKKGGCCSVKSAPPSKQLPIEATANKLMQFLLPTLLLTALATGIIVGFLVTPCIGVCRAISVLVVTCPCVLGYLTYLTVKVALSKGARNGVLVRQPAALQKLAKVDTLVLDKTGTLTQGELRVKAVSIHDKVWTKTSLLSYLVALETSSQHPSAKAIRSYTEKMTLDSAIKSEEVQTHSNGIESRLNSKHFVIGSRRLMIELGIDVDTPLATSSTATTSSTAAMSLSDATQTSNNAKHAHANTAKHALSGTAKQTHTATDSEETLYIAVDHRVIASITLADHYKDDAKVIIQQLKKQVKDIILCTGSDATSAAHLAKQLGIDKKNIYTEQTPQAKQALIKKLKKQGRTVAMVGDRENDTLALQESNVGLVMQSCDTLSHEHADIILNDRQLRPLLSAFQLAKQTMRTINLSLAITFIYNIPMIAIAAGAFLTLGVCLNPGGAALCMMSVSTMVSGVIYHFSRKPLQAVDRKTRKAAQTAKTKLSSTKHAKASANVLPLQHAKASTHHKDLLAYRHIPTQSTNNTPISTGFAAPSA